MFKNSSLLFFTALVISAYSVHSKAENFVCGTDLNNDGYSDEQGETTPCLKTSISSNFCPMHAVDCNGKSVASLNKNQCLSYGGTWSVITKTLREPKKGEFYDFRKYVWANYRGIKLIHLGWNGVSHTFYYVKETSHVIGEWTYHRGEPHSGVLTSGWYGVYRTKTISTPGLCRFSDGRSVVWDNPIGDTSACVSINGKMMAPRYQCEDFDLNQPEEEFDISGNMLTDDGRRDGEGNCIDTMMLFVGRGQSCKKPGLDSAWQNCCSYDGEVMNENTGSISQVGNTVTAIKGIYSISKAAYTAYSTALAGGATTGAAASAATSAASSQAVVAFDPTTLAVAAAVYLVTDFIAKACIGGDMDTAAAVSSGHCIEVGTYCSRRYKFIGCVQRKRSFCCFNGKMQRIFHEQGRSQLTTFNGFGSAKEPDCRGYTPEEFQALDFSKMDLSEYYEDLNHNSSVEVQKTMTTKTQEFYNNVK